MEDLGILARPNDEETTEYVESVRKPLRMQRKKKIARWGMRKENKWQFRLKTPMSLLEVKIPHCLSGTSVSVLIRIEAAASVSILTWHTIRGMSSHSLIENPLIIQQKLLDSTLSS